MPPVLPKNSFKLPNSLAAGTKYQKQMLLLVHSSYSFKDSKILSKYQIKIKSNQIYLHNS